MGLYSNTDYETYRTLAKTAIEELSTKNFDVPMSTLNSSDVLNSDIRKKCDNSLDTIISSNSLTGSIKVLKSNLKKIVSVMDLVQKYQKEEAKSEPSEKKLKSIEKKINNVYSGKSIF